MKKIKDKKTDASRRSFITKTVVGAGATAVTAFGQVKHGCRRQIRNR